MATAKSGTHGEGDYEATRRYRKRTEKFIAQHDVEKVAHQAAPRSKSDARDMRDAEARGRARAKTKTASQGARSKNRK